MSERPGFLFDLAIEAPQVDVRTEYPANDDYVQLFFASDASAAPSWTVSFSIPPDLVAIVQRQLVSVARELYRYLDGDRGGPTPEMKARLGVSDD